MLIRRLIQGATVSGVLAFTLLALDEPTAIAAPPQAYWCTGGENGEVDRTAFDQFDFAIGYFSDELSEFAGGRNTAQDCWNAAVGWLSLSLPQHSEGDDPAEICDALIHARLVDSAFKYGLWFNGNYIGYPIGTYYC